MLCVQGLCVFRDGGDGLSVREVNCHRATEGTWGKGGSRTNLLDSFSLGFTTGGRKAGRGLGEEWILEQAISGNSRGETQY